MAKEFAMKRKRFSVDLKVASQNRAVTRCHLMSPYGTSSHYGTEPNFPNSVAIAVLYRIPGTASEAGGRAFESRPGHHYPSLHTRSVAEG